MTGARSAGGRQPITGDEVWDFIEHALVPDEVLEARAKPAKTAKTTADDGPARGRQSGLTENIVRANRLARFRLRARCAIVALACSGGST